MANPSPDNEPEKLKRSMYYVFGVMFSVYQLAIAAGLFIVFIWPRPPNAAISKLLIEHFVAIVGLPCAALMAFTIVWILRVTEGPIEVEMLGFKFKGGAGPAILWTVIFLAITLALRVTW